MMDLPTMYALGSVGHRATYKREIVLVQLVNVSTLSVLRDDFTTTLVVYCYSREIRSNP